MGKIIRRNVTVTITETWTIVWADDVAADDKSPRQATTIVLDQSKTQEEQDEALQAIINDANSVMAGDSDPTAAAPDGVTTRPSVSSQRKRTRGRRAEGYQGSK